MVDERRVAGPDPGAGRRRWRRGVATGTGASASRQTLTNRPTAVAMVRPSITQSTGTRNAAERKPMPSRIIRSARSISPPLAEIPSDSALARW